MERGGGGVPLMRLTINGGRMHLDAVLGQIHFMNASANTHTNIALTRAQKA